MSGGRGWVVRGPLQQPSRLSIRCRRRDDARDRVVAVRRHARRAQRDGAPDLLFDHAGGAASSGVGAACLPQHSLFTPQGVPWDDGHQKMHCYGESACTRGGGGGGGAAALPRGSPDLTQSPPLGHRARSHCPRLAAAGAQPVDARELLPG